MLTRRDFFRRSSAVLVTTFVATKLPVEWLPQPVRTEAAIEFLMRHYRRYLDAHAGTPPGHMTAGRELYEAAERELVCNVRFTADDLSDPFRATPTLLFKGVRVVESGVGWRVDCNAEPWGGSYAAL